MTASVKKPWRAFTATCSESISNTMNSKNNIFYNKIKGLLQSNDTGKAISELEAFLALQTEDEIALSLYGTALLRSGNAEKAVSVLKRAAILYPDLPRSHMNLQVGMIGIVFGPRPKGRRHTRFMDREHRQTA